MIACGQSEGGSGSAFGRFVHAVKKVFAPLMFGSADVDLVSGTETSPNITQSETYTAVNPDDPNQIFVAYNDSRGRNQTPVNISGASYLHRWRDDLHSHHHCGRSKPFFGHCGRSRCSVQQTNRRLGLPCGLIQPAALRGSVGISPLLPRMLPVGHIFAFTTPRPTIANPAGPTTTRLRHSMGACIFRGATAVPSTATYSSDNGATWHAPIQVAPASPFIRDVQVTGDLSGNGVVYLAGMDEGGGGYPHTQRTTISSNQLTAVTRGANPTPVPG